MSNPQTLTQELLLAIAAKLDLTADNCNEVKAMQAYLKNQANKPKKEKKKKEPKPQQQKKKKPAGPTPEEVAAAKKKAAIKEGGKKGQDIAGLCDLGGVAHFHLTVDSPEGDVALLKDCMAGFNKIVDEKADDRKGGAGHIAKTLLTYNDNEVVFICHVPNERKEKLACKEWADILIGAMEAGKIVEEWSDEQGEYCLVKAAGNPDKEQFPIKMRDLAINQGYAMLVKRQLVMDDDSDDEINFADECDIEW